MGSLGRWWLQKHGVSASCELLLFFGAKTLPCSGCKALPLEIQSAELDVQSVLVPVSLF